MLFDEISFHDAAILEVKEDTFNQTIDFLLDFPTDWENNIFEKKVLRFKGVVFYLKKEMPFSGYTTIMEIALNDDEPSYNILPSVFEPTKYKAKINTTAGIRLIEFSSVEMLEVI